MCCNQYLIAGYIRCWLLDALAIELGPVIEYV